MEDSGARFRETEIEERASTAERGPHREQQHTRGQIGEREPGTGTHGKPARENDRQRQQRPGLHRVDLTCDPDGRGGSGERQGRPDPEAVHPERLVGEQGYQRSREQDAPGGSSPQFERKPRRERGSFGGADGHPGSPVPAPGSVRRQLTAGRPGHHRFQPDRSGRGYAIEVTLPTSWEGNRSTPGDRRSLFERISSSPWHRP